MACVDFGLSDSLPLNVAYWEDIFVLVDSGRAPAGHYTKACELVAQHAAKHPNGVGILTIVPEDASPPPDAVRKAMNRSLSRIEKSIRCLCWTVEGGGFQGAMVRAVCTGLRLFGKHPYPTHVTSGLSQALTWMIPNLHDGQERLSNVLEAISTIKECRASGQFARSF
jgi:hypothetical protein